MRRCDVGYAGVSAQLDTGRNIQSLVVNRYRNEPATGQHQSVPQKYISRLLDPDWGVRVEQNAGRQIQRVLRTVHHHDLRGLAIDGSGCSKIGRDDLTKLFRS